MLNLGTLKSLEQVAIEQSIQDFKRSRQQSLDTAVVETAAGNKYDADERSIGRMASALLAITSEPHDYIVRWSMADTPTGEMTITTKADLAEAHRLAVELMAEIWSKT